MRRVISFTLALALLGTGLFFLYMQIFVGDAMPGKAGFLAIGLIGAGWAWLYSDLTQD